MATYEKMVLISEAEYINLKNYKYLPHEIEGDEESGYDDSRYDDDDDNDESGYRPGRIWRQPQTPDDRHIETPSPSMRSSDFSPAPATLHSSARPIDYPSVGSTLGSVRPSDFPSVGSSLRSFPSTRDSPTSEQESSV